MNTATAKASHKQTWPRRWASHARRVISIESGRYLPSLPLAFRIARQFGVPLEQLFEPSDEEIQT